MNTMLDLNQIQDALQEANNYLLVLQKVLKEME